MSTVGTVLSTIQTRLFFYVREKESTQLSWDLLDYCDDRDIKRQTAKLDKAPGKKTFILKLKKIQYRYRESNETSKKQIRWIEQADSTFF